MTPWTFQIAHLRRLEATRWPGYVDDLRACAIEQDEQTITVDADSDCFRALNDKRDEFESTRAEQTGIPEQQPQAVPRNQWPWPARIIARMSSDEDKGVGDTIHRLLGAGGEAFEALAKSMSISCGCGQRRSKLNAMYPYT